MLIINKSILSLVLLGTIIFSKMADSIHNVTDPDAKTQNSREVTLTDSRSDADMMVM